jgi:two-component SAPR family response regulator
MRAMIVDDEPLSLDYFERLLAERPEVTLIGRYTDPHQALAGIAEEKPEVVFLDIEMPEINGISLAEQIQAFDPRTNIVFVTAYREYAIQAFELNAIDYLLKPIQKERLEKTLQRLVHDNPEPEAKNKQPTLEQICMLSSLRFELAGDERNQLEVKWRTAKARSYSPFSCITGKTDAERSYLDVIWTGSDPEKSVAQLYSAIYNRKLMEKRHCR